MFRIYFSFQAISSQRSLRFRLYLDHFGVFTLSIFSLCIYPLMPNLLWSGVWPVVCGCVLRLIMLGDHRAATADKTIRRRMIHPANMATRGRWKPKCSTSSARAPRRAEMTIWPFLSFHECLKWNKKIRKCWKIFQV